MRRPDPHGIVGAHLAPTRTCDPPVQPLPLVAAATTFALSRWIGRSGYRRVFTFAAAVAVPAGLISAFAVHQHAFWLFCVGTALIGVYQAGAGYYRYAAAESNPSERARAVSTVLAGGLVAALVGPFLTTAVGGFTSTPYVASYLLVAAAGAAAAIWNATMPDSLATLAAPRTTTTDDDARPREGPLAPAEPPARRRCGRARGRVDDVDDDRRTHRRDVDGALRG